MGVACGKVPVPDRGKVWGLPEALSVTETVALRLPRAEGVKVAAMVQVAPAGTVPTVRQSVPLAGVTRAKSVELVPPSVTMVIVRVPVPEFVNVEVICALGVFKR